MSGAEELDRSWDSNAAAWTRAVRERQIESRRAGTDAAIVRAVLAHDPEDVLDVGCGEGWLCRELERCGVRAVGVDGSAALLAAAAAASSAEYHQLTYDSFSRLAATVGAARFDVVVCNFSLLHEDISSILGGVHTTMKDGGVLIIQTVHPWSASEGTDYADGWRTETFGAFDGSFPAAMPWFFRTLGSWVDDVTRGGFHIERVAEPTHPIDGRMLSLILEARAVPAPR